MRSPLCHFPNRRQGIDPQKYPAFCKQLITRSSSCLHPHFANVSVQAHFPHWWLLHISTLPLPIFWFAGLGRYKLASGCSVKPCPVPSGTGQGLTGHRRQLRYHVASKAKNTALPFQVAATNCRSTSLPSTPFMALAICRYILRSSQSKALVLGTIIRAAVSVTWRRVVPVSRVSASPGGRAACNL